MPQIFAKIRIPASKRRAGLKDEDLRKAETGTRFLVPFDTGSSIRTIERSVWDDVSDNGRLYASQRLPGTVLGATGDSQPRTYVEVEIAYFRDNECKLQMGPWRKIDAIYSDRAFEHNLSGREIYNDFDFLVPNGNLALIMGTSKPALVWEYLTRSKEISDVALINEWAGALVAQSGATGSQGRAA